MKPLILFVFTLVFLLHSFLPFTLYLFWFLREGLEVLLRLAYNALSSQCFHSPQSFRFFSSGFAKCDSMPGFFL